MQITYCDYCNNRIRKPNEIVTLAFNYGIAPMSTNHFCANCARKIKSYVDGFLRKEIEVLDEA